MRFYHAARYEVEVSYRKNKEEVYKGVGPLPISWELAMVGGELIKPENKKNVEINSFLLEPFDVVYT